MCPTTTTTIIPLEHDPWIRQLRYAQQAGAHASRFPSYQEGRLASSSTTAERLIIHAISGGLQTGDDGEIACGVSSGEISQTYIITPK